MARIRFLSTQIFETGGPGKGPKFEGGFVLDEADVGKALGNVVTPDYAKGFLDRWVRRNVAVYVDARTHPTELPVEIVAPPPAKGFIPLGTSARGGPTPGLDDGKQAVKDEPKDAPKDEPKPAAPSKPEDAATKRRV